jgi:hypothetical protein
VTSSDTPTEQVLNFLDDKLLNGGCPSFEMPGSAMFIETANS